MVLMQLYGDKVHGTNMGPTWALSAPDGPHEPCYQGNLLLFISKTGSKAYCQNPPNISKLRLNGVLPKPIDPPNLKWIC